MNDEWIHHNGDHWGTARMVANHLGPDITEAMIRNWAKRKGP